WFSTAVGYVRQDSETYQGDRLLSRTQLTLTAFEAPSSAKATAPSASPPAVRLAAAAPVAPPASQPAAQSAEQESNLAGVTTRIAYLRQYNGALRLGVIFKNTTDKPV